MGTIPRTGKAETFVISVRDFGHKYTQHGVKLLSRSSATTEKAAETGIWVSSLRTLYLHWPPGQGPGAAAVTAERDRRTGPPDRTHHATNGTTCTMAALFKLWCGLTVAVQSWLL